MTVDFGTSLYFHPEGDGVLIGMSDREEGPTYDTDVSWDFVARMFEQAEVRAPELARASMRTAWAGLYESTPDHQAILGPIREVEGFWVAAGYSGHGFMQAPAAGLLLTQLLLDGRSDIDISYYSFDRFARGSLVRERNII
jgi:sarcosine oxidase subunit beta